MAERPGPEDYRPPQSNPSEEDPTQSPEVEADAIDTLPQALGFVETEELRGLHGELVQAIVVATELATRYQVLAEEVVNQRQDLESQIGLDVQMALIRREGGNKGTYLDDLHGALDYASNLNREDIAAILRAAIDEAE